MKCGDCKFLLFIEGQQYHDCRYDAPNVVVSGFKPNPQNPEASFGKIMTVYFHFTNFVFITNNCHRNFFFNTLCCRFTDCRTEMTADISNNCFV